MKKLILSFLLLWSCNTLADVDHAVVGQAADIGSTAAALALGLSEANPLFGPWINEDPLAGLLVLGGFKYGLIKYAESKPYHECIEGRAALAKMGYAMGSHNVIQILGKLFAWGSSVNPAAIVAGFATWHVADMDARMDAEERCFK